MVVATFKSGITMEDIQPLIPAEQAQAKLLEERGALGFIKIAMPRRTVFLEAFGDNVDDVMQTIESLPMAAIWDIEYFETTPPAGPASS